MKYISLLIGINVAGEKTIPMKDLSMLWRLGGNSFKMS